MSDIPDNETSWGNRRTQQPRPNNMPIGQIAFLGSGETSLAGGRIFETLARDLPQPLKIAILETPAGFELNSGQVAGRVAEFLETRLRNYKPQIDVIPARKRGTEFSPDDPEIVKPLLSARHDFHGARQPDLCCPAAQGQPGMGYPACPAPPRRHAGVCFRCHDLDRCPGLARLRNLQSGRRCAQPSPA